MSAAATTPVRFLDREGQPLEKVFLCSRHLGICRQSYPPETLRVFIGAQKTEPCSWCFADEWPADGGGSGERPQP